jgi:hypothetical protein
LDPGEAIDVIDFIAPHEAEHLADAGDGLLQIPSVSVMMCGGFDDGAFHVTQQSIIVADACQIDCKTFLHRGIGTALSNPVTVGCIGNLLTNGRQVILAVGMLHVGQQLGPFVCQMPTASQQIAGRPHLGRIHLGVREHAATEQDGDLVRVDRVVFGLPPMDGLHVQGMAEDERDAFVSTQVGQPVPGEQAFDRDDETLSRGRNDIQTGLRGRLHMTVHENLAALIEDADVHGTGMQVDAAVTLVLGVVKSPGGLLLLRHSVFPL